MKPIRVLLMTSLALGACTLEDTVRPTDMSAARHERAAEVAEAQAAMQARAYDPNAEAERQRCNAGGKGTEVLAEPCWTTSGNPTESHLREAAWFRTVAKQHRAAAKTLRDAETSACVRISDNDKVMSPFAHREDILSTLIKTEGGRVTAVSILVRGVPGMTADYLSRLLDCHIARNASMGFEMRELAFDPLNVKGAKPKVEAFADDFRVTLTADDEDAAREIARRANALLSRPEASPSSR